MLPGKSNFDMVTSFRLLLNMEPGLRRAMLTTLADMLNADGMLVVNTHGNPRSVKRIPMLWRRIRNRQSAARRLDGNYLSVAEVRELAAQAGLELIAISGCGLVSETVYNWIGPGLTTRLERAAARSARLSSFGINQMFILKRPMRTPAGS